MSVKVERSADGKTAVITLDNGHAEALNKITEDYGIVSEDKTIGFILSVMRDAEGESVETVKGSFVPSETILKKEEAKIIESKEDATPSPKKD